VDEATSPATISYSPNKLFAGLNPHSEIWSAVALYRFGILASQSRIGKFPEKWNFLNGELYKLAVI